MPVCFRLYPKTGDTDKPAVLQDVDAAIAKHFGREPDPVDWFYGWYDSIGFRLAMGKSFEEIKTEYRMRVVVHCAEIAAIGRGVVKMPTEEQQQKFMRECGGVSFNSMLVEIAEYIEQNYTTTNFRE